MPFGSGRILMSLRCITTFKIGSAGARAEPEREARPWLGLSRAGFPAPPETVPSLILKIANLCRG